MKKTIFLLLASFLYCGSVSSHPFGYDLHPISILGKSGRTMICFHGYGSNYKIAYSVKNQGVTEPTLISFNFPDHDILHRKNVDPSRLTFGTIDELLPAFYCLKEAVIDQGLEGIDLYGFSAGGGVVINLIAVLNSSSYDANLQKIGIGESEKSALLNAIQKGVVVLDAPLKSVDEILDFRGANHELEFLAEQYRENGFRPIDALSSLKGLSLHILLHFQENDEVLSNRDDSAYIERLQNANSLGKTIVIMANDGGHSAPHPSLWQNYKKAIEK